MASECSGLSATARGKRVHSDRKAPTHAVSERIRHKCVPTTAGPARQPHSVDEQDIIDLLELQRLTREVLDAMVPEAEAADLLRANGEWP